jgi:sulfide:quinone oxidoreductase
MREISWTMAVLQHRHRNEGCRMSAANPLTLETAFPDVYAVGDVTSVGTPKAGVFSEGQALVVAEQIISKVRAGSEPTTYDGHGTCYLEFGDGMVATVDVTFLSGAAPVGDIEGPSHELAASKTEFGTSRVQRWFDRSWTSGKDPVGRELEEWHQRRFAGFL